MLKIISLLLILNIVLLPAFALIEDDFVNQTLNKDLKTKVHQYNPIVDEFAQSNTNKNSPSKTVKIDEILPEMPKQKFVKNPVIIDEVYKKINVRIKNFYTTKNNLQEGEIIEFETLEDIEINNKIYNKNSTVKARIETTTMNKIYGVPSNVIVSNFKLDDVSLAGEISKTGANRILWVRPMVILTSWFFGLGLLFIPIRGGHAKIKPKETFTLYAIE